MRSALATLVIRKARLAKEEGAELYVSSENGRSGVVALRVERVERLGDLKQFLQHEFMHLHDMLDPAFGYSPHIHLPGQNAAQQRLTRERYRLLWDITIDARLARRCSGFSANRALHQAGFERMFDFWPESKRQEAFDLLWDNPGPQHGELLAIASDPRGVRASPAATPGSPCPLCGFATFDWSDTRILSEEMRRAIQAEFPNWSPAHGACGRCIRIYSREPSPALAVL